MSKHTREYKILTIGTGYKHYTPLFYYFWLRKVHKYSPKQAGISTIINFSKSKQEYERRVARSFNH